MQPKAFVLMPFAPEFAEIYNLFIAGTLSEAGYDVFRADDIRNQQSILADIISSIATSELIVADVTGSNPNVYYEIGIAHALRKNVILLTQSVAELPFDLRSYRVIAYNTHFAAIEKARVELKELAVGALTGSVVFGNPVSDYLGPNVKKAESLPARVTGNDSTDELGFIDHMVTLEEGFEGLSAILNEVTEEVSAIGNHVGETASIIEQAAGNFSSGTARHVQKTARKLSEAQTSFADRLAKSNTEYAKILRNIEDSLEFSVRNQQTTTAAERDQLRELLDHLETSEEAAEDARITYQGLATTIAGLPNMERHLTRANRRVIDEINSLVDNIDQTVSMISRVRALGARILRIADRSMVDSSLAGDLDSLPETN
jgi:uncharacterized protein YoxC